MSDEISPEKLVNLPRLDAPSAAALAEALQTEAANVKKLPTPIAGALKPLGKTLGTLHEVLQGRLSSVAQPPSLTRAADLNEDTAVSAFYDWLCALARLPEGTPEADQARKWLAEIFPDGVGFVKLSYPKEWTEVETRLARIKSQGYEKVIQEIGGKPFLAYLQKSHRAYGEALGITAPRTELEIKETAALREALQAVLQAVRFYVLRVMAHVESDEPATSALAARLLRPLTEWKSRPAKSTSAPESEPGSEPSDPTKT